MFGGSLKQDQVDGLTLLVEEGRKRDLSIPVIAYVLATAFHETAKTMQPIEEYGKGRGRIYGTKDSETGHAYYGRGHVQLTWRDNYAKMGRWLGLDMVKHPDHALNPEVSVQVIYEGMVRGMFTGRGVGHFINAEKKDYRNARRVVNGTDKAGLIAGYAQNFEDALAHWEPEKPVEEPAQVGFWPAFVAFLARIFGGGK